MPARSRALPLFAFIASSLIVGGAARADEAEDVIVDAIQRGERDGRHPVVILMESLSRVPDFTFTPVNIRNILDRAGVDVEREDQVIIGNFTRVTRRGDRIDLRTNGQTIPIKDEDGNTEARLRLDRSAGFRMRVQGGRLVMDDFDGVKAGTASSPMVSIRRVQLTPRQDGSVEAEVTVRILFFNRTERFILPARPPVVTASAAESVRPEISRGARTPSESIGVRGALGGALGR